jgi:hypothetical protein
MAPNFGRIPYQIRETQLCDLIGLCAHDRSLSTLDNCLVLRIFPLLYTLHDTCRVWCCPYMPYQACSISLR